MVEPNAGLFALPKPPNVDPVVLLAPKALLVLPNPPVVEVPNPVVLFAGLPKRPPVVFVLEPKGFEAGLLPNREPELAALVPKPVKRLVSVVSTSCERGDKDVEEKRADMESGLSKRRGGR